METITTTESLTATWAMIGMGLMCLVSMRMLLLRRRNRVSILLPVALVAGDARARFPITIDPFMVTDESLLIPDPAVEDAFAGQRHARLP